MTESCLSAYWEVMFRGVFPGTKGRGLLMFIAGPFRDVMTFHRYFEDFLCNPLVKTYGIGVYQNVIKYGCHLAFVLTFKRHMWYLIMVMVSDNCQWTVI